MRSRDRKARQTFAVHLVHGLAATYARVQDDPAMTTDVQEREVMALLVRRGFTPSDEALEHLVIEADRIHEFHGAADTAKNSVAGFLKASTKVGSDATIENWIRNRGADVRWRVTPGRVVELPPPVANGVTPSQRNIELMRGELCRTTARRLPGRSGRPRAASYQARTSGHDRPTGAQRAWTQWSPSPPRVLAFG